MASSSEESSLENVTKTFEACWEELVREYFEKRWRWTPIWCSEADVKLHLAHKLLNRLPEGCVHIELPIPLDVEEFSWQLLLIGRTWRRECIVPDIVVLNPENLRPILLAEIKFNPVYWSLNWLVEPGLSEEIIREIVKFLGNRIKGIRDCQKEGSSEQELEYFLGNIGKLIQVIKDFKSETGETVAGYLCVIDEFYPDIEDRIKKKIAEYNPPEHFKVLAKYYPAVDKLEEAREWLIERLKLSKEGH